VCYIKSLLTYTDMYVCLYVKSDKIPEGYPHYCSVTTYHAMHVSMPRIAFLYSGPSSHTGTMTFGPIMACIQQSAGHCRSPATGTQGLYSPLATMYVLLEVNIIVIVFIIVFRHEQGKKTC
jgi:hypothetical protein